MKPLVESPWSVAFFPLLAGLIHLAISPGPFFEWFVGVQAAVAATAFASTRLSKRPYRPFLWPGALGGAAFAALFNTSALSPANLVVGAAAVAIAAYVGYALAQI